ncbi:MAG: hypothetical protein LYZ66_03785 [Nitrososphaerales archaeon]|nr:hypothetical protein [Nitrososphaerales archaeon]
MSEEITGEAYSSATEQVDRTHREAVADVKSKVQKAKSEALKKLSS